ncbi:MAG: hypothetical protein M3Q48_15655, partial [Actinomycetota bacterium]|nr:hypothetical protein [Actinomycetota bacterium]
MASDLSSGEQASSGGEEDAAAAVAALLAAGLDADDAARRLLEPLASEAHHRWATNQWTPGSEQSASVVVDAVRALLVVGGHAAP